MDAYQKMYCMLFNKLTDIMKEIQMIQKETEEIYLSLGEDNSEMLQNIFYIKNGAKK